MTTTDRYLVISVGCLECSFEGDSEPEVRMTTDSLDTARAELEQTRGFRSEDRFIFDTHTVTIISSKGAGQ